jgi:PKD repeat protein/photosystem II stability/assembly factor-like uncharacterized protein
MASNWHLLGPTSQIPSGGGGAGRLNCVVFDPNNPQIIYVGAPAGGLWKSMNGGLSWTSTTDQLPVIGVSDVAIDPTNSNTVYIASGDNDHSDSYSCGVLKSTDGGLTWKMSGLTFAISGTRIVYCLRINPANPSMLFAGTNNGLFRTIDGGVTWAKVLTANVRDLEFKPGDPSVVYCVTNTQFYRSVNTGHNFTLISAGLPSGTSLSRLSVAVTAADPTYVYVLGSAANTYSFQGLYQSSDQGLTFINKSTTPNLLGFYSGTGGDATAGQGWYTLSLDVSPLNKNEVVVGGVNVWRSTTGGSSWSKISSWTASGFSSYVHADVHMLKYIPGTSTFFAAADGGCFKTTNGGSAWTDLSNGLQIAQMYRAGSSQTNPNLVIQGWQDNGTNQYSSGSWTQILGGDGMDCFIDYSNAATMYATNPNGSLYVSINGGGWSNINSNITGTGSWVTPWAIDPVTPSTIYAGFQEVWKSTNRGGSWTAISAFGLPSSSPLTTLVIAPSNPQYIYTSAAGQMYGTSNGGTSWTNLSSNLPGGNSLTSIGVSTTNPSEVWVTYSGYASNIKVYRSRDAGHTWTNFSAGLPNMPVNCVVTQPGTADGAYVGTDAGVYYKDTTMTAWAFFSAGLPDVNIAHLEIQASSKKLRAATFGRGLWETSLYDPASTAPLANFTANVTTGCPGLNVQFTDLSTNGATAWNWAFAGGTPATSTQQNPLVTFNNPGTYNQVSLTVSNANGSDSILRYSYIAISPHYQPTITLSGKDTICAGQSTLISSYGSTYSWSPTGSGQGSISPTYTADYAVTVTDMLGCSSTSNPLHVVVNPLPTPSITQSHDTLFSNYATGNQWYHNGVAIYGATGPYFVIAGSGAFSVHVTNAGGCMGISNTISGIHEDELLQNSMVVFPNPNNGVFELKMTLAEHASYTLRISDVTGREIYSEELKTSGQVKHPVDLSAFGKGMYMLEVSGPQGKALKKIMIY